MGVLTCGSKPTWPQLNFCEWRAFPSLTYVLISLVSKDTSTEPTHSYLIWGALLASTSQHVAAVAVVAVLFLFLSMWVLLTIPWVYFLQLAFLPHPDSCERAPWCNYWSVHPHLQPIPILLLLQSTQPNRTQEGGKPREEHSLQLG